MRVMKKYTLIKEIAYWNMVVRYMTHKCTDKFISKKWNTILSLYFNLQIMQLNKWNMNVLELHFSTRNTELKSNILQNNWGSCFSQILAKLHIVLPQPYFKCCFLSHALSVYQITVLLSRHNILLKSTLMLSGILFKNYPQNLFLN